MPKRVQRQRTKGWRMPEGVIYVGRPTVFGNIWRPEDGRAYFVPPAERAAWAVRRYVADAQTRGFVHYDLSEADPVYLSDLPRVLGGRDLACWCPLDAACHADYLLEVANA